MKKILTLVTIMCVAFLLGCGQPAEEAPAEEEGEVVVAGADGAEADESESDAEGEAADESDAADDSSETIKIGFIGPLTGDFSSIGLNMQSAFELAIAEVNEAGGINGVMLEGIAEDGQCNGKAANTAGQKLINVDQVQYIVGGTCSGETLAVAPIAEENEVVMISPTSSNPDITNAGDFIFRDYPSDSFQGKFAAEYVVNELGVSNVAILSCLSDWCVGLKDTFTATIEDLGGSIVESQEFEQGSNDIRTQLTKAKEAEPEAIYFVAYTESSVNGLKQAEELGIDVPILGGDTWDDQTIWEGTAGFNEGKMYVKPKSNVPDHFEEKFLATYGEDAAVTLGVPQTYDAVKIFANVLSDVGDDSVAVKDALYDVAGYAGVSGEITFDENGDLADASYVVSVITDGVPVEQE